MVVIKRDGKRQSFDRKKILMGIMKACEKRPVSLDTMEQIVTAIERAIQRKSDREIPSKAIGELVMEKLRMLDDVAYVRFASVYRQFQDISQFMKALNEILKKENSKKKAKRKRRRG